jgi:hypothetical protein
MDLPAGRAGRLLVDGNLHRVSCGFAAQLEVGPYA